MKIRKNHIPEHAPKETLADPRTLALLIARIKLFETPSSSSKLARQFDQLLASLERLQRILNIIQSTTAQKEQSGDISLEASPYIEGIPRWTLQVESQFSHYVNPSSEYQTDWAKRRKELWSAFERSIPEKVRDLLMSWRWRAELIAFKKIISQLEESQKKVRKIEENLEREERRAEKKLTVGIIDRLRIVKWSATARRAEQELPQLESLKQQKTVELSEILEECEFLSSTLAIEMKTALVDCGSRFPVVFEDCCRAIDNEIKKELIEKFSENMTDNDELRRLIDQQTRTPDHTFQKKMSLVGKINRNSRIDLDKHLLAAQELIKNEFLCLNAIEIEQQENAHNRWNAAVLTMKNLMKNAEENLNHGRGVN